MSSHLVLHPVVDMIGLVIERCRRLHKISLSENGQNSVKLDAFWSHLYLGRYEEYNNEPGIWDGLLIEYFRFFIFSMTYEARMTPKNRCARVVSPQKYNIPDSVYG